jgi:amino acid transporter
MFVEAGGAYYIISRSLGLQIGGAIGIPLFLAQTFSITLYCFGFAESLRFIWPGAPVQLLAALSVVLVSFLSSRGAGLALRLQIPIMVLIAFSLISLFSGLPGHSDLQVGFLHGPEGAPSLWVIFAVFFPAVTGIMAGVSLSGDLKNPTRSIPKGTIAAVLAGFVVYMAVPAALAILADSQTLIGDPLVWLKVSAIPFLVLPGLWGAILSSAVGSSLGAPRTLDALVKDGVMPGFLGSGKGIAKISRPHMLSTVTALLAVVLGDLNAVAPVLTMFFLTTYGMINLVAGLERLSGAPSFRPSLRIPWYISLAGAVGCFWIMFLINSIACIVALMAEFFIYLWLRKRAIAASWGDLRYGALMSLARSTLLQLRNLPPAPRNWRPHILVFAGDVDRRIDLIRFAAWLNQDRGILTISRLLLGKLEDHAHLIGDESLRMSSRLENEGITAFSEVEVVPTFEGGVIAVAQANGIAGITSNTIMFGWSEKKQRLSSTLGIIRQISMMGKSTVICRVRPRAWSSTPKRIDVWWGGLQNNGDMMLLFAYLLSKNSEWRSAQICVHSIASSEMMLSQTKHTLTRMLAASRISAKTRVTLMSEGESIQEIISKESQDADIVFMGLRKPRPGEESTYADRLIDLVGSLPTVILVHNACLYAGQLLTEDKRLKQ